MCSSYIIEILPILGLLFLFLSFLGAIIQIVKNITETFRRGSGVEEIRSLVDSFSQLVSALSQAPQWLLCFLIGIALIVVSMPFIQTMACS